MILGQIIDEIAFEAGVAGAHAATGGIMAILRDVIDQHTSLKKYDELYVQDTELTPLIAAGQDIILPTDLQHLDENQIRLRTNADPLRERQLIRRKNYGENVGPTFFYNRSATSSAGDVYRLELWPYADILTTDRVVINYWRKATEWDSNVSSVIFPDLLVSTVKAEAVARVAMALGDAKIAKAQFGLAQTAFSRSHGVSTMKDMNGN